MTPIVLQHGLFGFGEIEIGKLKFSYFNKIDRALEKLGHPVIVSRVHPTGPIEMRAEQLKKTIVEELDRRAIKERVIILAHSMGGLDARYMIAELGMAQRVAGLVTLSTPHRGSPYADWCLLNLGRRLKGLQLMKLLGIDVRAVSDLTTDACRKFNRKIKNHPQVLYYSVSAARPWHLIPAFMIHSHKLI